ncbi:MAG TPA: FAD-binding oxidoreductase [Ktedonosporobacter sp.]|nr:FAD-binding oxidoreductase [Ktedonosporobacter sp.]
MGSLKNIPQSWGRYPKVKPEQVVPIFWRDEIPDLAAYEQSILPYAYGRSYGDSCLNEGGIALDMSHLRRFMAFDDQMGVLRCEAGVSLAEVLELVVPRGWFIPVSPGTKFVSVGGAIANDVHGKNHYKAGTFGCYVNSFELLRSSGERLICTPTQNSELFRATIGGLGLTGVILWAEFRLKPISNPYISVENIRYGSLKEFKVLADSSDQDFEYTVAWVDCLARGSSLGRGIFIRGNHDHSQHDDTRKPPRKLALPVPIDFPSFALNTLTIKAFNTAVYNKQLSKKVRKVVHYDPFFYPLDAVLNWNRIYGKRGFFQYQCIVPYERGYETIEELLGRISASGEGSFLTVFKKCGDIRSPGMLSFPRPGLLLALDFPNNGSKTRRLFQNLDQIVRQSGGIMYPAKDALMSAEDFQAFYPQWKEFEHYIDPKFSSSFWRRVTVPVPTYAMSTKGS